MKDKIAIIDPGSFILPYDYFYISELSKMYDIDFYCSYTNINEIYIEKLRENSKVTIYVKSIYTNKNLKKMSKILGFINYISLLLSIIKNIRDYRYVHFMWSIFPPLETLFFFIFSKKIIFTLHNDKPHSNSNYYYLPYQILTKLSSKVVFVSQFTRDRFLKHYTISDKVYLINHGILPLDESPLSEPKDSKLCIKKEIIFWGRVIDYKGVDIFDVYRQTFNKYNVKIIGRWDKNLNDLKSKLQINKNIIINDEYISQEKLYELMQVESLFILPYKNATQSGVLYTLLFYKRVFIASNIGETYEFLKKYNLSQLAFDREDEKTIQQAIDYAFDNYEDIQSKLLSIRKDYEWSETMKEINKLYD